MRNRTVKIIALVLAVLMALSLAVPVISYFVRAQTIDTVTDIYPINVSWGGSSVDYIAPNRTYRIQFDARVNLGSFVPPSETVHSPFNVSAAWSRPTGATLTLQFRNQVEPGIWDTRVTISQITYISTQQIERLMVSGVRVATPTGERFLIFDANIPLPFEGGDWWGDWGSGSGSGSGNDNWNGDNEPGETFSSSIIVESVVAHDAEGNILRDITRDTPPFSLQITFTDHGLAGTPRTAISEGSLAAFLTDTGTLIPMGSMRGTMRSLTIPTGDPPRFVATFNNLRYAGGAPLFVEVGFRAQYSVRGQRVFGDGTARFFGIVREDDEDDEPDPFTPHIILSSHYFGGEPVPAGNVFTLSMDFMNTSREIDLHNIIMVVSPVSTEQQQSFLTIASDTNTYFFDSMPAGGTRSQSIDILVMAAAAAGSQAVSVAFNFEYMVGGALQSNSLSTTVHIPITQIDRFTVSPITELSEWLQLGDEGYVVVSFVNMGQATTFNVSGFILDAEGNQTGSEHFGNLEAGASGSLDFSVAPNQTGEHFGTVVIRYENEVGEEMTIEESFAIFVDEPWFPEPDWGVDRPGMHEPEPTGMPWWRYLLIILGSVGIATPIALYIIKRVKAKESEVHDEDF